MTHTKIILVDDQETSEFCIRIPKPQDSGAAKRALEHIRELLLVLAAVVSAAEENAALSDAAFEDRMVSIQAADMLYQAQTEELLLRAELLRDAIAGRIRASDLGLDDLEDV